VKDEEETYREAATGCLDLARAASDQGTRLGLLSMAQRWLEMANSRLGRDSFRPLLRDFDDQQLFEAEHPAQHGFRQGTV
jgi:hypothetical protein